MRPTFEEIRKVDDNGKEYWSSRELCNAMGYSGYWKFQNVIDKAIKVASEKGMDIDDHFNHVVEMVKLGSGSFRKVEAFHLSRMACMIISENADSRKLLVKQARAYFSQSVSTTELMRNSLESNILLYKTAQGETRIEVIFNNETFWMSQKKMAALFGVDVRTISYHIGQIYETGELDKMATIRKIGIVQTEGERDVERAPLFYNLDVIIAVGYRVNSYQATQFRIWATSVLKEFIIKGYVLDDERLKQGKHFGKDYFDDLLERIREIRTSERRYYQKITDIYAECSADYDAKAESTKLFYKMVQNMMHLAVTNHTAASELMRKFTTMEDWKNRLKLLLETMDYDAKSSAGKVSQEEAREKAYSEYEKYKVIQDRSYISDFDRFNSGNDDDTPLLPFDIDPKE
ncbi:cell filamentation protein Fic [Segatella copri]|uniref:Cell filamentation protein Fic n=2 Tax=Prevotellaceae TaxID=171552 RepID=A0AA92TVU4_9BACT|nr:cell filamentation protein Fic [Segatella copri]